MPYLPKDPYAALLTKDKARLQGYVDPRDKGLLMTVLPVDEIYGFLVAHALKTTANFIRTNNLQYTDKDAKRLTDFIQNGFVDLTDVKPASKPKSAKAGN
jgi:hypothetical protein